MDVLLAADSRFNQRLGSVQLPKTLETLTFGGAFNQSLDGVEWPSGLQSLTLGLAFNQPLDGISLPESLRSLTMGGLFRKSLPRLPSHLEQLTLKGHQKFLDLDPLADSKNLERLSLGTGACQATNFANFAGGGSEAWGVNRLEGLNSDRKRP